MGFMLLLASVLTLLHNVIAHCHEHQPISESIEHNNESEELPFLIQLFEKTDHGEGHLEEIIFRSGIQLPDCDAPQVSNSGHLHHLLCIPQFPVIQGKTSVINKEPFLLASGHLFDLGVRPPPIC